MWLWLDPNVALQRTHCARPHPPISPPPPVGHNNCLSYQAVRLFNLENEHRGFVRHVVSVGLGKSYRAGINPAACDSLDFVVIVTEGAVGLIEDLDCVEQKQSQERERQRVLSEAMRGRTMPQDSPEGKSTKRTGTFLNIRRPHSAGTTKDGPPISPNKGSPVSQSTMDTDDSNRTQRLHPNNSPRPTREMSVTTDDGDLIQGRGRFTSPPTGANSPHCNSKNVNTDGDIGGENGAFHGISSRGLDWDRNANSFNGDAAGGLDCDRGRESMCSSPGGPKFQQHQQRQGKRETVGGETLSRYSALCSTCVAQDLLLNAPVLLYSYTKLLHALVCGSYDLRAGFVMVCEAELRNIGREGGYLDMLAKLDGGAPRMVYRESARFLLEILIECDL